MATPRFMATNVESSKRRVNKAPKKDAKMTRLKSRVCLLIYELFYICFRILKIQTNELLSGLELEFVGDFDTFVPMFTSVSLILMKGADRRRIIFFFIGKKTQTKEVSSEKEIQTQVDTLELFNNVSKNKG